MTSDLRRQLILGAAKRCFARHGFAGTTTRELAEAANISEGLLFRHFPSKKHLYGEILHLGCEGDPALERLASLEPSTITLVRMVHCMVRYFLLAGEDERTQRDLRLRLVLHSFLEDGEYARQLFETIFARVHPLFAASIAVATASGDLAAGPIASRPASSVEADAVTFRCAKSAVALPKLSLNAVACSGTIMAAARSIDAVGSCGEKVAVASAIPVAIRTTSAESAFSRRSGNVQWV